MIKWRDRFAARGLAGLDDEPRSGRPKTIDDAQIIAATLEAPPASLAVTHWSSRLLGRHLGIGDATVARAWRAYRVQPWRSGTFKFSTDPELEAKVCDVVGLYLNPPEQRDRALHRREVPDPGAQSHPADPAGAARAARDARPTTTSATAPPRSFAALEVATGTVTDRCYDRHGKAEFLDFLKHVAKAYPRRKLHVVLDNYHTHKHDDINQWLAKHPRITLHFTPTSGSWLNLVEVFFGIITRQAIRRGSFENVKQLIAAIRAFIDGYNERCQPFIWTKTADADPAPRHPSTNFRRATLATSRAGRLRRGRAPQHPPRRARREAAVRARGRGR